MNRPKAERSHPGVCPHRRPPTQVFPCMARCPGPLADSFRMGISPPAGGECLSCDARKDTKGPPGDAAQDGRSAPICDRLPPVPHYRRDALLSVRANISGAQNLSGRSAIPRRATSSSRISYPSLRPAGQSSLTSIAPPLQRKPASLGFALGAAFGGLFGWKISAGAGPLVRLGFFS